MWQYLKCHWYNYKHFILKLLILCRFTKETDEIIFFDPLLHSAPFYTPWKAQITFSAVIKREYWEEISEQGYLKENIGIFKEKYKKLRPATLLK